MTLQGKSSKEVESGLDKKIVRLNDDSYQFNFDNDHDLTTICDIAEDHKQLLNHPLNEAYILPMWNKIRGKLRLHIPTRTLSCPITTRTYSVVSLKVSQED